MRILVPYRLEHKLTPYLEALRLVGLDPVPAEVGSIARVTEFSGLLLTGGTDIGPELYGAARHPETQGPDRERDDYEFDIVREALRRDMPVLAICRGMQLLNVVLDGTLIQHIEGDTHRLTPPDLHDVHVSASTLINPGEYKVNSRHHQAVAEPGTGVMITGRARDGVIESFELPEARFVLAVQWHPEDRVLESESDRQLFERFCAAVR